MVDNRPKFLNLMQIKFPVTAIASIAQRISGVLLFVGLPILLYYVQQSLASAEVFNAIKSIIAECWLLKVAILLYLAALLYHTIGGIRHLIMDVGFLEQICIARFTARATFVLTVLLIIPMVMWLW